MRCRLAERTDERSVGDGMTAKELIEKLHLEPLIGEGGYFRRSYESEEQVREGKPAATAIYYLLTDKDVSALHKLPADEVYHFYLGDPVELLLLCPDGTSRLVTLGQQIDAGMEVQFTVPKGCYQGSMLRKGGKYALLGTTMCPGYTDDDYTAGEREALKRQFPQWAERIDTLTAPK